MLRGLQCLRVDIGDELAYQFCESIEGSRLFKRSTAMKSVKLLISVCVLLLFPLAAWAGQVNVSDDTGFGPIFGLPVSGTFVNVTDNYTIKEQTFLSGSVYTYEYSFTVNAGSQALSQLILGSNAYDPTLNYGINTGFSLLNAVPPVTTGTTPLQSATFLFGGVHTTSLLLSPHMGAGTTLVFYLQSLVPPGAIGTNVVNGALGDPGNSIGPVTPEPTSMALLGSGLALMGGFLRRYRKSSN
jgi:hypothetical protein